MGRLVLKGGTGRAADSMCSCTVIERGIVDGTKGGAIREPAEELGDAGAETVGVEPGMDASNAMVSRTIKRSNIPDT